MSSSHSTHSNKQSSTQQQSLGDVQVQGDDNIFNAIQANVVTLTQNKIIQISVDEIKTRPFIIASPYKGLRSFEPEDEDQFFGRDQFLAGLVNELEQTNLMLLLGASGSGKSSVVRAGLIPWLRQKWGTRWVNLTFTPDQDPFESLYGSLLSRFRQSEAQVVRAGEVDTLSQLVESLKQPASFWFIFIDQFEELFTISTPDQRDRFITSLAKLCKERAGDHTLKIVATMRADFLDRLDTDPANRLARATERHRPLITQMHPDELRLAIEQPAAYHGVVFETGLVETIIKDVQGQAGYLPLLQYTLNRLWETEQTANLQQERMLHTSTYLRLGGVRGTLQRHVEHIYQQLQQEGKHLVAQRIFLKLVEIGGDTDSGTNWRPVRRRANRSEFKDELEKTLLARLIDEKLVVSDRDISSDAQESTVEIAHEILLTSWTRLNSWIKENRQGIALRNRLNDDVALWQLKKGEGDLWSGSKLQQVLELREDAIFNQTLGGFSPLANEFINVSAAWRDQERQRRQRRRLLLTSGLTIGLILTSSLASLAWWQSQRSILSETEATAKSSQLFFSLDNSLDALIEAIRANRQIDRLWQPNVKVQAEAQAALWRSVYGLAEFNRLEGHTDWVWNVAFSPKDDLIATVSLDNTIRLWKSDGSLVNELTGHGDNVHDVAFSSDGQMIVSAGDDGTVKLWTSAGDLSETLKTDSPYVFSVAISPDGQTIASAGSGGTIQLWRRNGSLIKTLPGHQAAVRAVDISPDGKTIASASEEGTLKMWTINGTLQKSIPAHTDAIFSVAFSPDSQTIATASSDHKVSLWRLDGTLRRSYSEHQNAVYNVAFSPNGKMIASVGSDRTVQVWRPDGLTLATFLGHQEEVWGVAFSPNNKFLATAGGDRTVRFWQLDNTLSRTLREHTSEVWGVAFSPDGKTIASASRDQTVKLWNSEGIYQKSLGEPGTSHNKEVRTVAFSPDNRKIATASWDKTAKLWSRSGSLIATLDHADLVNGVAFSPDSQAIATASSDHTVKLWSSEGEFLKLLEENSQPMYSVAFSPDGQRIATASYDGKAKIWTRQGKLITELIGHTKTINEIVFSPNGEIATASWDKTVRLWSKDGKLLNILEGHTDAVSGVAFSPDGEQIATASWDKTIKLWRKDGSLLRTFTNHSDRVTSVAFSPDSDSLASASKDKTVILWDLKQILQLDPLAHGCTQIRNYLHNNPNVSRADRKICD